MLAVDWMMSFFFDSAGHAAAGRRIGTEPRPGGRAADPVTSRPEVDVMAIPYMTVPPQREFQKDSFVTIAIRHDDRILKYMDGLLVVHETLTRLNSEGRMS